MRQICIQVPFTANPSLLEERWDALDLFLLLYNVHGSYRACCWLSSPRAKRQTAWEWVSTKRCSEGAQRTRYRSFYGESS
jgi:hypothetical protein